MSRCAASILCLALVASCTESEPPKPTLEPPKPTLEPPKPTLEPPKIDTAKAEIAVADAVQAELAPPVAEVEAAPTTAPSGPPAFHAFEHRGRLNVEIVVDLLDEADQKRLRKLAKREIAERTGLTVAPGDARLPEHMRAAELTIVGNTGVASAKVVEVLAGGGPSGAHGILVLDRPAKKGEHALAVVGAGKNPTTRLEAIATAAVGDDDPMRSAAIQAAKSTAELGIDAGAWKRAKIVSLADVRKSVLGGVYLLNLELEDGGLHALYGNAKDGHAVPLLEPSPEGTLALLGKCDLDGDGNDEILARLDAFEGRYVVLLLWDASKSTYTSTTIAGDGT